MNKVVAHFLDGHVVKGFTNDFVPGKDQFHVTLTGVPAGARGLEIDREHLKALFFVKDFEGDSRHQEQLAFDPSHPCVGRRIQVVFLDGEVLVGTTLGYQPGRPGLFLEPADHESNIRRCYVVSHATKEIAFL